MVDGDEVKEFIMGNEDVLKKFMIYMVSIIELYNFLINIDELLIISIVIFNMYSGWILILLFLFVINLYYFVIFV